ncbi:hypothetical protein Leryth_009446 [Lithospermum erythrorhizon]|nr:hypothetical protein Leryth_009446 [Lithospermum erythrorhizon]
MSLSSPLTAVIVAVLLSSSSGLISSVHSESHGGDGASNSVLRWEILTNQNFSSDIQLHHHIFLIVTVPWSGESRSLMKELPFAMDQEKHTFDGLKLRFLFRNNERMLADALGAAEGITIFYYRQTVSYKYQGRLRMENILSSVRHAMSVLPEELPLKNLNTQEDLRAFLDSTDKSLLLLEFCGWTQKLLAKSHNNITKGFSENYAGTSYSKETDVTVALKDREEQKVINAPFCSLDQAMEDANFQCDAADDGIFGIPKPYAFGIMNDNIHLNSDTMGYGDWCSCRFDQFQLFEKFLPNFLSLAREYFLPPERLRFGVVRDKSLLPLLNVKPSCSWVLTLHLAGCPNCSKVLEDVNDLRTVVHTQSAYLSELQDDSNYVEPALPENMPSVLLFIDRSSLSSQIREESSRVLGIFRELASSYQNSDRAVKRTIVKSTMGLGGETSSPSMMTTKQPRSLLLPGNQNINHKDKVSVMIMKDGKHVNIEHLASELEGSSLQEILTKILQKQKELKLSSLVKDAGFQLLSEDMHINYADAIPAQSEVHSGKVLGLSSENAPEDNIYSDKEPISDMSQVVDKSLEVKYTTTLKESSETVRTLIIDDTPLPSVKYDDEDYKTEIVGAQDGKVDEKGLPVSEEHKGTSRLSFFFYDGQHRLLRALTSGTIIPCAVIVDPISERHYVFPRDAKFSYSELSHFIHGFLNESLPPYQQSEPIIFKTREGPSPPFVNRDFREVNSIPRVTTHTFSELVAATYSDPESARQSPNRNILILFSNSWCGFCQRMELVVREVYRAIKDYANILKEGMETNNPLLTGVVDSLWTSYGVNLETASLLSQDVVSKVISELPLIYLMDCTVNDCSLIMNSTGQRELYPALLLFPAGSKSAVAYEGDVVVSDVFKFLTDYGCHVHGLVNEKGFSYAGAEQARRYHNLQKDTSVKGSNYEVLLKDRLQNPGSQFNQITTHSIISSHETNSQVIVGSMLVATEKLVDEHPFDESKILIVKADQSTGYQGLIVNKHINWDSLEDLEEALKVLTEAPLSFGGPVMRQGMPLVALTRHQSKDDYLEVLPTVYFLHQRATLDLLDEFKAGNQSVHDYWFFLGFSRWGWQQLFSEIAEGAWNVAKGGIELLDWPGDAPHSQTPTVEEFVEH